jgi:alkylation response protein AidB-like acyl-CoA dehydrogenase
MTMKRHSAMRRAGQKNSGLGAGVEGNLAKILNTKTLHLARDLSGAILGPDAIITGKESATAGVLQELILFSPAPPIYGGTDEIQRNVIGERGLGLPKEPGPSKDTPFVDLPK